MKVICILKNLMNQVFQQCIKSQLIEVMKMKMHSSQFGFLVHLLRRKWSKFACRGGKRLQLSTKKTSEQRPILWKHIVDLAHTVMRRWKRTVAVDPSDSFFVSLLKSMNNAVFSPFQSEGQRVVKREWFLSGQRKSIVRELQSIHRAIVQVVWHLAIERAFGQCFAGSISMAMHCHDRSVKSSA
jgi:hypothetical protein